MTKTLVIVESPAKAKTIGKFLGSKYKVIASNGHVRDLPKSKISIDVENGFTPKYITLRGRGDVLEKIRKEAKASDRILLATDPDREGEAISWHLCSILNLDQASKCRIEFNEITNKAVKGSIKNARPINMNLVNAQQARRILDRLVGYEISPLLWRKIRKGLSAGRVQSVATRIVCDREKEINDFVPKEFWNLTAKLMPNGGRKAFEAEYFGTGNTKQELHTEEETQAVIGRIGRADFTVTDLKKAEAGKHPAPPFMTSTLQQSASSRLGFTTKRTMMIAQQLYEGIDIGAKGTVGLITYMRTDSVRIAAEAQEAALKHIGDVYGPQYVPEHPNIFRGRAGAQDAHEAIRPTDVLNTPSELKAFLTADQYKLYKLIYERFLASQMCDAKILNMTLTLDASGETFKANGHKILFDGYRAAYGDGGEEGQEKDVILPELAPGTACACQGLNPEQRFTQPPPRYTEATLVRTLEEKGIGRPSTYAPTISTILERGYIAREKKALKPTELGVLVNKFMMENFPDIVDIQFTASMEDNLDKVEVEKADWVRVLNEFYGPFHSEVQEADAKAPKEVIQDEVSDVVCEKCGAPMLYKYGKFGKFLACSAFPKCRNTKPVIEKIDAFCPECGGAVVRKKTKKGKTFYGCENYPNCTFTSWDMPTKAKCPKCGKIMVMKSNHKNGYLACIDSECGYVEHSAHKDRTDE